MKIIFILLFLSANTYAQYTLTVPDRALIDKKKLAQCMTEVDKIKSLQLKCDTLYAAGNWFTGLYFDKQGQLRKNIWRWAYHDGTHEYITLSAYYNATGELVYVEQKSGCNCTDEEEYFYLHKGHIVDCGYFYSCGCCEEDEQEWIDNRRPVIGSVFVDTEDWWRKYFISVESTLNFYYERYQYESAMVMPGVIPIISVEENPHFQYVKNLKSLYPYILLDSIDNPKAYFLECGKHPYNTKVIAVKEENQYAVFLLFPDGVPSYGENKFTRQDVDGSGNDELVIRWKNPEKESGILVWNLDNYSCLLNIQEVKKYYDLSHYNSEGSGYKVGLGKKRLTVQIVKNYEKGILGLRYVYKYTKSGFVLDKVE